MAEGVINQKERPELESSLQTLLADPRLAPYFAEGLAVETEREILIGGHTHRAYKPDRIVFGEGASRAAQSAVRQPAHRASGRRGPARSPAAYCPCASC